MQLDLEKAQDDDKADQKIEKLEEEIKSKQDSIDAAALDLGELKQNLEHAQDEARLAAQQRDDLAGQLQTVTANYENVNEQNQKYEADLSDAKCKIEELENQIK